MATVIITFGMQVETESRGLYIFRSCIVKELGRLLCLINPHFTVPYAYFNFFFLSPIVLKLAPNKLSLIPLIKKRD